VSVDNYGRVCLTRTNRQKNSEFDIRGHRDWMTPSISLHTVEERRAFSHSTFAPERSKENEWRKDLNFDGVRLAPGYGSVALTLKDEQQVFGVLAKETASDLTLTNSEAEPLIVPVARIAKRENLPSGMPPMGDVLSKREIRDMVEFLSSLGK